MQKKNDLYVLTKAKDLSKYIFTITEKSPKKFRYTMVAKLQNGILDILENLHKANSQKEYKKRLELQSTAKDQLILLDFMAGLAFEVECILFKQYEQISKQQAECLLYLKKWMASTSKLVSTN